MLDLLANAGVRSTRSRKVVAALLFNGGKNRHVTAKQLHREALITTKISLATIYNTLNTFTRSGLLQEVLVEPGRSFFDTNVTSHYHFYFEDTHALVDIPAETGTLLCLPTHPKGTTISRVDLIIRVRSAERMHPRLIVGSGCAKCHQTLV
jgi:Fur family transcriptional regulator, iron response regulator